ncbi:hypothetical protein LU196_05745 [Pantoea sp. Mb-10]|uniref:hypothetical protein n=1 Tax=unclassified Pantoea TaxID=2630326 RepID=UPI001E2DDA0E|nr:MULTISPECIES: hypothetical protein [unclassified Pantoea]MCE0489556.1 hypothetical protein [Pantoea sp. Mb-10]MCE0502084.1 hypothetical protein [Pantoea sp. Pb-8]
MSSIKLTVKRLYQLHNERMVNTRATARIYLGDRLVATEEITGMTESPVSKYVHAGELAGQTPRVEWDCIGIADMAVTVVERCPCCQDHQPE